MVRVVLDTNVLITADQGVGSFAKRILDLVRTHEVVGVVTRAVTRENELLVARLVHDEQHLADVREYLALAVDAEPTVVDVVIEDDEDVKLLEAAVGGGAQFLITDDKHLLTVGEYRGGRVVRPVEFWQWWEGQRDERGATWASWAGGVLGK